MQQRESEMAAIKIIIWIIRAAIAACYVSLLGSVLYFPFAYIGTQFISPLWRQYPFTKHIIARDAILYIFCIAMFCTLLQVLNAFLERLRTHFPD